MTTLNNPPTKYGLVLFPGFQILDAFGPVDMLNILGILGVEFELEILAATLEPVSSRFRPGGLGQSIVPTYTFDTAPSDIEVLLIPGGMGSTDPAATGPVICYLQKAFPSLRYLLTVCTGSAIAAAAGVLDGRRATTNKMGFYTIKAAAPKVDWVLESRWVVDGKAWTSSGVSAGIDMTLAFVSEVYGEDMAEKASTVSEYRRATDPSDDPFAKFADVDARRAAGLLLGESQ